MNIYVYLTALGMIIIGLYFVHQENKREREEKEQARKRKDDLERQYRDHYIE